MTDQDKQGFADPQHLSEFSQPIFDNLAYLLSTRGNQFNDADSRSALAEAVTTLLRTRHGVEARVKLVGAHALPQTSSGKLSRSKARAAYLAGTYGD